MYAQNQVEITQAWWPDISEAPGRTGDGYAVTLRTEGGEDGEPELTFETPDGLLTVRWPTLLDAVPKLREELAQ